MVNRTPGNRVFYVVALVLRLRVRLDYALPALILACACGVGLGLPLPQSDDSGQTFQINSTQASPNQPAGPVTMVRGMVKNTASGEPLPRVLVQIGGDATSGALTDGDGRFEIAGVPIGAQTIQITKPGFHDRRGDMPEGFPLFGPGSIAHSVFVQADMAELVFQMAPTNSIRGQIALSTGDTAQGITVVLLHQSVQDGRAIWMPAGNARTNSDGIFRFAALDDGDYALSTLTVMETELAASVVAAGNEAKVTRNGYDRIFYPDARDISGAGKIHLEGGQQAQANINLTLEPFHLVSANVLAPNGGRGDAGSTPVQYTAVLVDAQGHDLPYNTQYIGATHTVQALVPDGTYTMQVSGMNFLRRIGDVEMTDLGTVTGRIDFSVAGHPVTNLRVPLSSTRPNAVQVNIVRNSNKSLQASAIEVTVLISQAGAAASGMISGYAEGPIPGTLKTEYMSPGSYWVTTSIQQSGLCEASFTAGGADLGREPLVIGPGGSTPPLVLTLRDDCATLKLNLPSGTATPISGEEPSFTVYVIPDFNSTNAVTPLTLRPSSGGTLSLEGLTPGSYHVYTFAAPVALAYRNPEALAALPNPGQAVTLSPGATMDLVVEAPTH